MPESTALPPGFIEALDEKTRQIVMVAVLAERQAAHERADVAEFSNLRSDIQEVKEGLTENSRAQKSYALWIIGMMLVATGTLALLYLTSGHHV
jgi:hypothetical protein